MNNWFYIIVTDSMINKGNKEYDGIWERVII